MANLSLIRDLCNSKGITLKELAKKAGLSETGLQRILNSESLKVETLEKIARGLKVPVTLFFSDDPNEKISFTDEEYDTFREYIKEAGLSDFEIQMLGCLQHYNEPYVTKDEYFKLVFLRFEEKAAAEKKFKEYEELISSFKMTIKLLHDREFTNQKK